jgi:hypothetical protein
MNSRFFVELFHGGVCGAVPNTPLMPIKFRETSIGIGLKATSFIILTFTITHVPSFSQHNNQLIKAKPFIILTYTITYHHLLRTRTIHSIYFIKKSRTIICQGSSR